MKFSVKKVYKLKGERNISARTPLVYNDRIYVIFIYDKKGFFESRLQCLDLETFALKWEYTHNHVLNNIELSAGADKLLCGCMDGEVKCFHPDTGELLWNFKTEESNIGAISNIYDGKIIVSGIQAFGKSTWCLNIESGRTLWQIDNTGHAYVPSIADGTGFFCIERTIYAIALEDGTLRWERSDPETYLFNPRQYGDTIVVGGYGKINLYDPHTGEWLHSAQTGTDAAIREIRGDDNHHLYFGDEAGNFYCYSLEVVKKTLWGKRQWRAEQKWVYRANGAIQGASALLNGAVYFISDGQELVSLDSLTGSLNWCFNTKGKAAISSVSTANGEIFVACGNGYVYRLKE